MWIYKCKVNYCRNKVHRGAEPWLKGPERVVWSLICWRSASVTCSSHEPPSCETLARFQTFSPLLGPMASTRRKTLMISKRHHIHDRIKPQIYFCISIFLNTGYRENRSLQTSPHRTEQDWCFWSNWSGFWGHFRIMFMCFHWKQDVSKAKRLDLNIIWV